MGKYERKRKKSPYKVTIIVTVLVVVLVFFVLFALPQILFLINGDEEDNQDSYSAVEDEENNQENHSAVSDQAFETDENKDASANIEPIQFPVMAEDGKIEITSVFQFDGINPDCDNKDGENTAAITLKNLSDSYLDTATVNVFLADGTEHSFVIHDIPPEKSVMAFSIENLHLPADYVCVDIHTVCSFDDTNKDDRIDISVNATSITLTNITDEDLINVVVYCHDVFDDKYFGGITYKYTVDKIPAGESTTINASDSLIGVIDVVQIAANN